MFLSLLVSLIDTTLISFMFSFFLGTNYYFKGYLLFVIGICLLSCLRFSGSSPASSTVGSSQSNSMKYQRENDSSTLGKQKSFKKPQGEHKYHVIIGCD